MSYRDSLNNEELKQMLSAANKEREESNKRLQELENRLKAAGLSIIPKQSEVEKKPLEIKTNLKVEVVPPRPRRPVPRREPQMADSMSRVHYGMLAGFILPIIFIALFFFFF